MRTLSSIATRLERPAGPRGFTLIELLVVIAIVLVLASLLMPTLNRAMGLAKSTMCLEQLRSMGMSVHLYVQESPDYLLPRYRTITSDGRPTSESWISLISGVSPYSFTEIPTCLPRKAFVCPSQPEGGHLYQDCYNWSPWKNVGYTYNFSASALYPDMCPTPTRAPLIWDGRALAASGQYGYADWLRFSKPLRHMDGLNFVFLDTHAEHILESSLEKGTADFRSQFVWSW